MSKNDTPHVNVGCVGTVDPKRCPDGYVVEKVHASTKVDGKWHDGYAEVFRPNSWDALMALGKEHIVEMYFAAWAINAQAPIRRKITEKVKGNGDAPTKRAKAAYKEFIFTE